MEVRQTYYSDCCKYQMEGEICLYCGGTTEGITLKELAAQEGYCLGCIWAVFTEDGVTCALKTPVECPAYHKL